MDKMGFVYLTENTITGKKYIGRKKYMEGWEEYLGSSKLLKADVDSQGPDTFTRTILEECETYEELQQRELYWQLHYKAKENPEFYNLTYANEGFDTSGTRFSYSEAEVAKIWPNERRKVSSDYWKDPVNNPNNLPHVKEARSKRMKESNIFHDPEFQKQQGLKKRKKYKLEWEGEVFTFNGRVEMFDKFGNAGLTAWQKGYKKNNPFKGLKRVD